MTDNETEVLVDAVDGILTITINRPHARNAVTLAVARGIAQALDRLESEADLRVGILTGQGDHFSSGMDLKGFLRGETPTLPDRGFGGLTLKPPAKPLIAAVEGYALAGGFELVMACDLVVASASATFGIPEVKRGLCAGGGGLLRLTRQLPSRIAMELALTGGMLSVERANAFGMVNRMVPAGHALPAARQLAAEISANGPLAVAASKKVITQSVDWSSDEQWDKQAAITGPVLRSADAREGAAAFADKRSPRWQGA
jgi:enoyl-CoA hydratase